MLVEVVIVVVTVWMMIQVRRVWPHSHLMLKCTYWYIVFTLFVFDNCYTSVVLHPPCEGMMRDIMTTIIVVCVGLTHVSIATLLYT